MALSHFLRDVLWLRYFRIQLQRILGKQFINDLLDIIFGKDNQVCIMDAQRPALSDLSKHIYLKYQLLVDHVRKGELDWNMFLHIQLVLDILTNNLTTQKFRALMELLRMGLRRFNRGEVFHICHIPELNKLSQ